MPAGELGFIAVNPSQGIARDSAGMYISNTSYAGTNITSTDATGHVSNSPFLAADFTGGSTTAYYKQRLVSAVAVITYVGPADSANGLVHAVTSMGEFSMWGITLADIQTSTKTTTHAVKPGEPIVLVMNPVHAGYYIPSQWKYSINGSYTGAAVVAATAGTKFYVEVVCNYEIISPETLGFGAIGGEKRNVDPAALYMAQSSSESSDTWAGWGRFTRRISSFVHAASQFYGGYLGPSHALPRIEL
jgi:hypothetical protein